MTSAAVATQIMKSQLFNSLFLCGRVFWTLRPTINLALPCQTIANSRRLVLDMRNQWAKEIVVG